MAKILIIDDESNVRLMLRLALQKDGHEVSTAPDGAHGLEVFDNVSQFDLILLDYRMPEMDGMEVLREINKRNQKVKVVMITAFGTLDLASDAIREGVAGFLRKPFTTEILRGTIATVLKEKSAGSFIINGFSISWHDGMRAQPRFDFEITAPDGHHHTREVELSTQVVEELHKYNVSLWSCARESLANYLWQNAEIPDEDTIFVDEISTQLRRHLTGV